MNISNITYGSPDHVSIHLENHLFYLQSTVLHNTVYLHDLTHGFTHEPCPLCHENGLVCTFPYTHSSLCESIVEAIVQSPDFPFVENQVEPTIFFTLHPHVPFHTAEEIQMKIKRLTQMAHERGDLLIGLRHDLNGYMTDQLVFPDEYLTTEQILRNPREYTQLICTDYVEWETGSVNEISQQPLHTMIQQFSLSPFTNYFWERFIPHSIRSTLHTFLSTHHLQWRMNVLRDTLQSKKYTSQAIHGFYQELCGNTIDLSATAIESIFAIPQAALRNNTVILPLLESHYHFSRVVQEKMKYQQANTLFSDDNLIK